MDEVERLIKFRPEGASQEVSSATLPDTLRRFLTSLTVQ